jgi:catalase
VRFSTVAGSKGSPDLARDVRGFAVKLYTKEGNWDLVGNNIPVFFIQDAIKFPDIIHAAKEEPDRGFPQAQTAHDNFWDFISLNPESMHMALWIMSDRTIPRSFRFMEGFGVHTFRLVTGEGKSTFVKFHWKPKLGMQSVMWNEALKINGMDPDFHRRDLWDAIQMSDFPEWELGLQLFDDDFADKFDFDVLDATKRHCQVGSSGRAVAGCGHDDIAEPVPGLSLPARGHPACRVALSLLHSEPA